MQPEHPVAAFFNMDALGVALKASRFDLLEEITGIIGLTRSSDPKVKLAAYRHLRQVMHEIAKVNGLFGTEELVAERHTAEGQLLRLRASRNLIQRIKEPAHAPNEDLHSQLPFSREASYHILGDSPRGAPQDAPQDADPPGDRHRGDPYPQDVQRPDDGRRGGAGRPGPDHLGSGGLGGRGPEPSRCPGKE